MKERKMLKSTILNATQTISNTFVFYYLLFRKIRMTDDSDNPIAKDFDDYNDSMTILRQL